MFVHWFGLFWFGFEGVYVWFNLLGSQPPFKDRGILKSKYRETSVSENCLLEMFRGDGGRKVWEQGLSRFDGTVTSKERLVGMGADGKKMHEILVTCGGHSTDSV